MSLIADYRATEEAIKELQERLNSLKGNESLQKEIEFEQKLRELMGQYNKSLKDLIAILDPESAVKRGQGLKVGKRSARAVKIYKNPHTGEVVETKGGNHKVLKEWGQKWGKDEVKKWVQA